MKRASSLLSRDRSYEQAIALLDQRRRLKRPITHSATHIPGLGVTHGPNEQDFRGTPSILGMKRWLEKLGHSGSDINQLNIIHVAGTKGKGSTCAFTDSFLRAHGKRTGYPRKVGLYTSPHLIHPEERIRINFRPLPRDLFAKYFFEVDDILSQHSPRDHSAKPRYLQLFALLAFHVFIKEGVDAAIFETHHGGEYDSTNVVESPLVTVVTTLGLDHMKQLGPDIESIAWHKAGIFKPGALAISAPQEKEAAGVLQTRAAERGASLQVVDESASRADHIGDVKPHVQRKNCSVAVAATRAFLSQKGRGPLTSSDIRQGISQFSMPGRFQIVLEGRSYWFLDSAHNEMSVSIAAEWFRESCKSEKYASSETIKQYVEWTDQFCSPSVPRVLIFSHITDQRDGAAVFERLAAALAGLEVQNAILTTYERSGDSRVGNEPRVDSISQPDRQIYADIWKRAHPKGEFQFEPSIEEALEAARMIGARSSGVMQTLITGSQHLVGGALSFLQDTTKPGEKTEGYSG